jgi:hypothetical protein
MICCAADTRASYYAVFCYAQRNQVPGALASFFHLSVLHVIAYTEEISGYVSKITKARFCRLGLHIFVEKHRRSTTAPAFFVSICKPIQHNCIFQTLVTHPSSD